MELISREEQELRDNKFLTSPLEPKDDNTEDNS
jgi:hypothetical protein